MKRVTIAILVIMIALFATYVFPNQEKDYSDLSDYEVATFAGGCFWCMEAAFEAVDGVVEAVSGYTGGTVANPTYQQVTTGNTGHLEAVQVYYDPNIISFSELVEVFWRNINPTDAGGQFVDRGSQYATAIFYHDEIQKIIGRERDDNTEVVDLTDEMEGARGSHVAKTVLVVVLDLLLIG